jgi:hypothetical protein
MVSGFSINLAGKAPCSVTRASGRPHREPVMKIIRSAWSSTSPLEGAPEWGRSSLANQGAEDEVTKRRGAR